MLFPYSAISNFNTLRRLYYCHCSQGSGGCSQEFHSQSRASGFPLTRTNYSLFDLLALDLRQTSSLPQVICGSMIVEIQKSMESNEKISERFTKIESTTAKILITKIIFLLPLFFLHVIKKSLGEFTQEKNIKENHVSQVWESKNGSRF